MKYCPLCGSTELELTMHDSGFGKHREYNSSTLHYGVLSQTIEGIASVNCRDCGYILGSSVDIRRNSWNFYDMVRFFSSKFTERSERDGIIKKAIRYYSRNKSFLLKKPFLKAMDIVLEGL